MLRFLAMRILAAIPVLLVMSVITFAIIQAPPGDYGDFVKSNLISQGGASVAAAERLSANLIVVRSPPLKPKRSRWAKGNLHVSTPRQRL